MLYIECPTGSGLSTRPKKYINKYISFADEAEWLVEFLLKFFKKFPKFAKRDIILSGESGGGAVSINLAAKILKEEA